ncbi:MAG: serine/threonine protein phosphatase [Opitutaceae bacterium]|jgi:serine/threonine protein phosphatase 1|nr:serine/threonine protein phosphatase [Opitutaceae bacterium]
MRILAIGDIHGSLAALETLVSGLSIQKTDTLVTLGDYVDRGPDSRGVVDYLLALRGRANLVTLLGNHEAAMMDSRRDRKMLTQWIMLFGGEATLDSYGVPGLAEVPRGHWDFFEGCRLYYETETEFFVHAGVAPGLPLDRQPAEVLLWERFETAKPHCSGKRMICGHTIQPGNVPRDLGHAVCIDTAAYAGDGWLTCLDTRTNHYWQANNRRELREGKLERA